MLDYRNVSVVVSTLKAASVDDCVGNILPHCIDQIVNEENIAPDQVPNILNAILLSHQLQEDVEDSYEAVLEKKLKEGSNSHSELCGYAFKKYDLAFNCRTCQADDTCVLCQSCFENSDHTGHDVLFHRTEPGGMCDCGDLEAWAESGFCHDHGPNPTKQLNAMLETEESDLTNLATLALIPQVVSFLRSVGKNTKDSFSNEVVAEYKTIKTACHHLRLCNDDIHDYLEVQEVLRTQGISESQALTLISDIEKKGCDSVLSNVNLATACGTMKSLTEKGWFVNVVNDRHLRQEAIAIQLVKWLNFLCLNSTHLLDTTANHFISSSTFSKSVLSEFFTYDPYFCSALRTSLHGLYMTFFGEKEWRYPFAAIHVKSYEKNMRAYLCGKGLLQNCLFGFGVQIFTTASVVYKILESGFDLYGMLLGCLNEAFELSTIFDSENDDSAVIDSSGLAIKFKRYIYILNDLQYICNLPGVSSSSFFASDAHIDLLLNILRRLQGMNAQLRRDKSLPHVSFTDMGWMDVFNLHFSLSSMYSSVLKGLYQSNNELDTQNVDKLEKAFVSFFTIDNELLNDFDVSSEPVSFHYPAHHFFAKFLLELLSNINSSGDMLFTKSYEKDWWLNVCEYPLRVMVLCGQIEANMWNRNDKRVMQIQALNYQSLPLCQHFQDLDYVLLIIGGFHIQKLNQNFLRLFLTRFGLLDWFTSSDNDNESEYSSFLAEECLLALVRVLTQFPPPSRSSPAERNNILRAEVLHKLACNPSGESLVQLMESTQHVGGGGIKYSSDTHVKELTVILKELGKQKTAQCNDSADVKYELDQKWLVYYDPCFSHLSRQEHEKADANKNEYINKLCTADNVSSLPIALTPAPPVFGEDHLFMQFRSEILRTDLMLTLIHTTLHRTNNSERLLLRVLHLLTLLVYTLPSMNQETKLQVTTRLHRSGTDGSTSILQLLVDLLMLKEKNTIATATISNSTGCCIHWILNQLDMSSSDIHNQLCNLLPNLFHVDTTLSTSRSTKDEEICNKMKRKTQMKERQKQAMEAMMKRQKQFLMANKEVEEKKVVEEEDTLECIVCNSGGDGFVYMGFSQLFQKQKVVISLCGHAIHLACAQDYRKTLNRSDFQVIQLSMEEFLCPLCQSIRNTLVPAAKIRRHKSPNSKQFLDTKVVLSQKQDVSYVYKWLNSQSKVTSNVCNDQPSELMKKSVQQFTETLLLINSDDPRTLKDVSCLERLECVWSAASSSFESLTIASQSYCMFSSLLPEKIVLNNQLPKQKKHLLLDLPQQAMQQSISSTESSQLKLLWESSQACVQALLEDFENVDMQQQLYSSFMGNVGMLQPLITLEPMQLLVMVVSCSCEPSDAEILMIIRSISILHYAQVLHKLQHLPNNHSMDDVVGAAKVTDQMLTRIQGLEGLCCRFFSEEKIKGVELLWLFESSCNFFFRQVHLFCRFLFPSLGIEFPNNLTDFNHLVLPLGIPFPEQVLSSTKMCSLMMKWFDQIPVDGEKPNSSFSRQLPSPPPTLAQNVAVLEESYVSFINRNFKDLRENRNSYAKKDVPDLPLIYGPEPVLVQMKREKQNELVLGYSARCQLFVPLPHSYMDLHLQISHQKCPVNDTLRANPALCLLCGEVLCAGSDCCKLNEVGSCTRHQCRNDYSPTGVFFLLKKCCVLLCFGANASFYSSLYVDKFGEEDHNLRRGRLLYLNLNRLQKLLYLVCTQQVVKEVVKSRLTGDRIIRANFY